MTSISESAELVPEVEAEQPKRSVAGYRVLAVLVFLIAAGGLFLGAIPSLPSYIGGASFLTGSLLSGGYDLLKVVFSGFSAYFSGGVVAVSLNVVFLAVYGFLAVAVLISLTCMIVSLCSRKAAEKSAMCSAVFSYLAYFGAFAWAVLIANAAGSPGGTPFSADTVDAASGITAGSLFVLLAVTAIVRRKGAGFAHVCLHLLVLAVVLAVVYPSTLTEDAPYALNLINAFGAMTLVAAGKTLLGSATLLMLGAIALCIIVSAVRMGGKKAWAVDAASYGALTAFVVFYAICAILANDDKMAFFSKQLMPAILLLVAPVAALLFAVVAALIAHKHASEAVETAEEEAETPKADEEFAPIAAKEAEKPAEPAPEPPAPEPPITEFERRMAALASGAQPEAVPPAPMGAEPAQPSYFYGPRQPQPVRQQLGYFEVNTQYTYDPFINTLTPQEKNEFGDIFIAGKYGDLRGYLPPYVIGGNNDEFFHRVFIYLGKFRKNISSELLEKLYSFIATIE